MRPLLSARYADLRMKRDEVTVELVLELPIKDAGRVLDVLGVPPPSSRLSAGHVLVLPIEGQGEGAAREALAAALELLRPRSL